MIQPCIARALECIPLSWKRTQARSFLRLGGSWLAGRRQAGLDAFHAAASMTEIGEGHIREAVERADIVGRVDDRDRAGVRFDARSEEHTSELQSLMRISYAVFCLKKTKNNSKKKSRKR